jgi:hypothetical protein
MAHRLREASWFSFNGKPNWFSFNGKPKVPAAALFSAYAIADAFGLPSNDRSAMNQRAPLKT